MLLYSKSSLMPAVLMPYRLAVHPTLDKMTQLPNACTRPAQISQQGKLPRHGDGPMLRSCDKNPVGFNTAVDPSRMSRPVRRDSS